MSVLLLLLEGDGRSREGRERSSWRCRCRVREKDIGKPFMVSPGGARNGQHVNARSWRLFAGGSLAKWRLPPADEGGAVREERGSTERGGLLALGARRAEEGGR